MEVGVKMENIDITKEKLDARVPLIKEDFSKWLNGHCSSIKGLESDIVERGGSLDDIFTGLACMDIEVEFATELARSGDIGATAYTLAQVKHTKDFVYGKLIESYGGVQEALNGLSGNLGIWRDYIMEKSNGGERQCEFILGNLK